MKSKLAIIIALLSVTPSFAKTHQDNFTQPCPEVWKAVKSTVLSDKYGVVGIDNEDMAASYTIGGTASMMFGPGKRINSVSLHANGQGCTMATQTAFTGLVHNDAGDFLKRVQDALSRAPVAAPVTPAPVAVAPTPAPIPVAAPVTPAPAPAPVAPSAMVAADPQTESLGDIARRYAASKKQQETH